MDSGFSRRCVVDTNTVRQPEPFGTDHGVIHEMIVTGRNVGADKEFYSKLAHDIALFRRVVNFVKGNLANLNNSTPEIAAEIMGDNFHGIDALERHLGIKLSSKSKKLFLTVPFSPEVLQACRETHMLVACGALSLINVKHAQPGLFYVEDEPWYEVMGLEFARTKVKAGWQLVRKSAVPNSSGMSWDEQNRLLEQDELVPNASVLAQAILIHYLETRERLFKEMYVRVSDKGVLEADDSHVFLGDFFRIGLHVGDCWDGRHSLDIGLSSSRKFN